MVSAGLTINLIGYGTLAGPLLQHWPIFQAHKMQSKPEEGFQELGPAPAEAAAEAPAEALAPAEAQTCGYGFRFLARPSAGDACDRAELHPGALQLHRLVRLSSRRRADSNPRIRWIRWEVDRRWHWGRYGAGESSFRQVI